MILLTRHLVSKNNQSLSFVHSSMLLIYSTSFYCLCRDMSGFYIISPKHLFTRKHRRLEARAMHRLTLIVLKIIFLLDDGGG